MIVANGFSVSLIFFSGSKKLNILFLEWMKYDFDKFS